MKIVELNICVEVPDDFEWDSELGKKLEDVLMLEDVCEYDSETGCAHSHWGGANVISEEEYNARYEDE